MIKEAPNCTKIKVNLCTFLIYTEQIVNLFMWNNNSIAAWRFRKYYTDYKKLGDLPLLLKL